MFYFPTKHKLHTSCLKYSTFSLHKPKPYLLSFPSLGTQNLTFNHNGNGISFSHFSHLPTLSQLLYSLYTVCVGWNRRSFPSLRSSRFRICAVQAQPETVEKVCEIVRKQLALSTESELTPDTKFSDLGADSLDTVEIVMGLEEEFGINVEEDGSQNISTVQEAADLIEKLVQEKKVDQTNATESAKTAESA
ncbi:hypothetical protein VIGAN_01061200 [Vigna angularis var. angularis]|uniref:Acyl carrier protein n=1 Tax=Vigna angularis var. angularis TaxID=157739 RepID=A0A0S3QXT4_PHAAN|nr:hypothetical protein VIGAN_01061200 [Vigna angularis var. angularis]